jgi:cytochrome c oxidase subunit 2
LPLAALVVVLAGCGDSGRSTLHPAGKPAREITQLWWVMLIGSAVVFAVVMTLLLLAFVRRKQDDQGAGDRRPIAIVIGGGLVAPIVVLSALFGWDTHTIAATSAPAPGSTALSIQVIGHQWWWEVRYLGTNAVTANEIHIPARTRVEIVATTADVIHSFWVPELNRKIDMIPGRVNRLLLDADHPGVYSGECLEFCGLQHAHMSFRVYADPPAAFRRWLADQARPAAAAYATVFGAEGCADCHQIRGTPADGHVGPDLTHLASRDSLAGDTIRNDEAHLRAWISDPQHVKPGNRMPAVAGLTAADLDKLVSYLRSLE